MNLIERTIAEMCANPNIRQVSHLFDQNYVELPDGGIGEVVGNFWEGTRDTGSKWKLLVAMPDAAHVQELSTVEVTVARTVASGLRMDNPSRWAMR
jgi:hypothetical protein